MSALERYAAPRALGEALELLRSGGVTIVAGGTDLMPQSHSGKVRFESLLMNIRRIPELSGIALEGDTVRIGALTSITALLGSAIVRERLPILAEAADHFASEQVRNGATVGGNVCNASPAGDMLVPLIVLDATVELAAKPDGSIETRSMPLQDFLTGPGRTRRAPHELLTAVRMPLPKSGSVSRFYKYGTRPGARHLRDLDRHRRGETRRPVGERAGRVRRGRADADPRARDGTSPGRAAARRGDDRGGG